jgi:hypothetical protein
MHNQIRVSQWQTIDGFIIGSLDSSVLKRIETFEVDPGTVDIFRDDDGGIWVVKVSPIPGVSENAVLDELDFQWITQAEMRDSQF